MRNDRCAILSLVALGRLTPSEAERLLLACNASHNGLWIFAACLAAALFILVPHQGLTSLLHVPRVLLADHSLHHALFFIHRLSGEIQ